MGNKKKTKKRTRSLARSTDSETSLEEKSKRCAETPPFTSSSRHHTAASPATLPSTSHDSPCPPPLPTACPTTSGLATPGPSTAAAAPPATSQISSDFTTRNPYELLGEVNVSDSPQSVKPPPIYVKGVSNFTDFAKQLSQLVGRSQFICKARSEDLAVFPATSDIYRKVVHWLRQKETLSFHTYQLKEEKTYRVVIRYLHPSTDPGTIRTELDHLGFLTRNVTNVLHPVSKTPLSLFFVDLEPAENNRSIFGLSELCYCKIKVEEPHKKKEIVQCKNCQSFGHTRSYCNHSVICSRCSGNHATAACKKDAKEPPKCANCNGSHPASYRGCIVHKELQRRRIANKTSVNSAHVPSIVKEIPSAQPPPDLFNGPPLPQRSVTRIPQFSTQEQISTASSSQPLRPHSPLSYAAVANSKHFNDCHSHPASSISTDLNSLLTSFLSDLKSTIQPLISLLTNVLAALIPALTQPK